MDVTLREKMHALVQEHVAQQQAIKKFIPGETVVPVSGRCYDASDVCHLMDATMDFWLTTGRFNDEFQIQLAKRLGVRSVLTVNSGSSANLVAFSALTSPVLGERALKPGDEVITVAAGFPTTVNPILLYGCVPVFVDVDMATHNIDVAQLREAVSDKTRAIMIAHTLGNPFNVADVMAVAKEHDLWVIEDCCDALGSTYQGKHVGTFGDIGTLSFYPAHHITMGEGGAVFTDNVKLKKAMESIRDWGRDCWCAPGKNDTCGKRFSWELGDLPSGYDHKYIYSHLGFNLKITDMQAAVGVAQLAHLDEFIDQRKKNFKYLYDALKPLHDVFILPEATSESDPSWFGFLITLCDEAPFSRQTLIDYLDRQKIDTRCLFAGNLTKQPYMRGREHRVVSSLERTDKIMTDAFWIGVFPGLTQAMLDYVVEQLTHFVKEYR